MTKYLAIVIFSSLLSTKIAINSLLQSQQSWTIDLLIYITFAGVYTGIVLLVSNNLRTILLNGLFNHK